MTRVVDPMADHGAVPIEAHFKKQVRLIETRVVTRVQPNKDQAVFEVEVFNIGFAKEFEQFRMTGLARNDAAQLFFMNDWSALKIVVPTHNWVPAIGEMNIRHDAARRDENVRCAGMHRADIGRQARKLGVIMREVL